MSCSHCKTNQSEGLIFQQVLGPSTTVVSPTLSITSVHSIPTSSSLTLQNTFSSDSLHSATSFDLSLSSPDSVPKYSSPSLRCALLSKKNSLYKARKFSSKDLLSLVSPIQTPLSSQISQNCQYGLLPQTTDEIYSSFSETGSASSYPSSFVSDIDINSLYSNPVSTTISTICEVDDDSHPLGDIIDEESLDETTEARDMKIDAYEKKTKLEKPFFASFLNTFKQKLINSPLIASTRLFYRSNELFFTNAINNINIENKDIVLHDILPLETFHTAYKALDEHYAKEFNTAPRSRECRINPSFLRFFAIDASIKKKYSKQLLDGSTIDYFQYEFLNSGYSSLDEYLSTINPADMTTTLKFQLLSRDKMWSKVVLPPRADMFYNQSSNSLREPYIKVKNEPIENGSLVRENGKVMPWLKLDDCAIQNKRCFSPSGTLPNNIQYTVKNWEKKRWSPISL